MGRPKKRKEVTIKKDKTARIITDSDERQHLVIIEEKDYYIVSNRRSGMCFFKREDGKEDCFEGYETKDDITERELKSLKKSRDFEYGWLVQEVEVDEDKIDNANTLSDTKMEQLVKKHKNDSIKMQKIIDKMTSDFAVTKIKDLLIKADAPSSAVTYCEFKLKKIEEEYLETQKAPIDTMRDVPEGV